MNKNLGTWRNKPGRSVHVYKCGNQYRSHLPPAKHRERGKSVGQQERTLRNKVEDLAINIVAVYREDEDEAMA